MESDDDSDSGSDLTDDNFDINFSDSDFDSEDDADDSSMFEPSQGIESDDDMNGCCHWSKEQNDYESISKNPNCPMYGKPTVSFADDTKPVEIVEMILKEEFIDKCIDSTNEHARDDVNFANHIALLEKNEKGRSFVKGFLAIKWHLGVIGLPQFHWAWSEDGLKSQAEIKKVMTYKQFRLMVKHFRCTSQSKLPPRNSPDYHPLQNILEGTKYLQTQSAELWVTGEKLCIDEGRIVSKSKMNPYKTRNPDKPIRMGWTVDKVCDMGEHGGYYVYNHLVKVGKHSYTDIRNGKITMLWNN